MQIRTNWLIFIDHRTKNPAFFAFFLTFVPANSYTTMGRVGDLSQHQLNFCACLIVRFVQFLEDNYILQFGSDLWVNLFQVTFYPVCACFMQYLYLVQYLSQCLSRTTTSHKLDEIYRPQHPHIFCQ